jgi:hypothetical protein
MYHTLVLCMAGPLVTGQEFATYLLSLLIPIMIYQLVFLAIPKDPMLLRILAKTLVKTTAWHLRGHPRIVCPKKTKCFKKQKKRHFQKWNFTQKPPSYLVPAFIAPLRLVVTLKLISASSCAPSRKPHGSWHSKVLSLTIQRSDLTRTHSPSESTITRRDAWPMPPTFLKTSNSQTMQGR